MKRQLLLALLLALCLCICTALVACGDTEEPYGAITEDGGYTDKEGATTESSKTDITTESSGTQESNDGTNGDSSDEEEKPLYTREDNKIYFGSYPQTEVSDEGLIEALTEKAGELPTSENPGAWTSYKYYVNTKAKDFMWYVDMEQGGEKYRGVYFTSYRNANPTADLDGTDYTWQDENGYRTNTVYWFKYEPVAWTILKENDGKATLICDMVLDSQSYDYDGQTANNYKNSTIRAWLNNEFYNTAFDQLQKGLILLSKVDNSLSSTGYNVNNYTCTNTEDYVYLLSRKEYKTYFGDSQEYKGATDYALSQGVCTYNMDKIEPDKGNWWLRTPATRAEYFAMYVKRLGADNHTTTYDTDIGVVPVIQITLN